MQKAGGSILLVDDDEAVLDVFTRILQKEGFPVTAVKSIEAAKQSVEESEYAVVLYDLSVGGMRNALELASVLQDEYPTMKVLMITGMVSPDVAAEVTRRGLEILEKPLGVKTLVRVISCHVKKEFTPRHSGANQREDVMKKWGLLLATVATVAIGAQAKDHFYQKGRIQQMDSVSCGYAENSSKTIMGEIVGTDGAHKKTKEMLCQEYVLKADRVMYRIRPQDEKHPVLLPVGEDAEFRINKDKLKLRVTELDNKERDYVVVSMTPVEKADASGK